MERIEALRMKGKLELASKKDSKRKRYKFSPYSVSYMCKAAGITRDRYGNLVSGIASPTVEEISKFFSAMGYVTLTISMSGAEKTFIVKDIDRELKL